MNGRIVGAVLAGGRSARMGQDKALIRPDPDGARLVDRVIGAIRAAGITEIAVVGAPPTWPPELIEQHTREAVVHVPDRWPGEGPLGGIISALLHSMETADWVFVAPCDVPDLDATDIVAMTTAAVRSGAVGCIAQVQGRVNPVVACLSPLIAAGLLRQFDAGERRVRSLADLSGMTVVELAGPAQISSETSPGPFDLDTPTDLARWRDNHAITDDE
jgi:molybdenum cofactor guanylyltransferase